MRLLGKNFFNGLSAQWDQIPGTAYLSRIPTALSGWTFTKRVKEGEMLPKGYGKSYWEYRTYYAVCHPIPFNWIIGALRTMWTRLEHGLWPSAIERKILLECKKAHMDGYALGVQRGEKKADAKYKEVHLRFGSGDQVEDVTFYTKAE